MENKKHFFKILIILFISTMIIACGAGSSRIIERDLVGIWILEEAINAAPFPKFEQFSDGTGILYIRADGTEGIQITWQLRDGNRLQTDSSDFSFLEQIHDIELLERGTLLIFHYDSLNYDSENPSIGKYRKR